MSRVDEDAILNVDVYTKKTQKIPEEITQRCRKRLRDYDATT